MFKKLINEAVLTVTLRNEGPLLINSGPAAKIQPRSDMSFVRTARDGKETVYLPGSSIKGVFRSRYEQVMRALGQDVCDTFDSAKLKLRSCAKKIEQAMNAEDKSFDGCERYKRCCEACKLFGSLALGGRITFADAYPVDDKWEVGMRHGVGIDRITGAAFPGALYDIEILEYGVFKIRCKMMNFKLYQLRAVLWVLEDIDDGLVTFGMGGSRGNGQMRIDNKAAVELIYRKYADNAPAPKGEEIKRLFGGQISISGLSEIIAALSLNSKEEIISAINNREVC